MIHLALRTEFSFKKTFGHVNKIVSDYGDGAIGIADINSTYGHVKFSKACGEDKKPIFGVRLMVVKEPTE